MTKSKTEQIGWQTEFGPDYEVPEAVLQYGLFDCSWRNDMCPSFCWPEEAGLKTPPQLQLWIEHPDSSKREFEGALRYLVALADSYEAEFSTDDMQAALAKMTEWRSKISKL